jgi:hypothetical protein
MENQVFWYQETIFPSPWAQENEKFQLHQTT